METLVFYTKQNKFDKYLVLPSKEKQTIDNVVADFIQELVTTVGSNAFDRLYGTDFIKNISRVSNKEKIEFFIKKDSSPIWNKYGILSIEVKSATMNPRTTSLDVVLVIEFEKYALETALDYLYSGVFTTKDILEI